MKIIIKVTKKHIKLGICDSNDQCPIALALLDRGYTSVSVGPREIEVNTRIWKPSPNAAQFIQDFDQGKTVKPQTFVLSKLLYV